MALCNLHFIRVRTRNYLNGANEIKSINNNERFWLFQIGTTNAIIPCNWQAKQDKIGMSQWENFKRNES